MKSPQENHKETHTSESMLVNIHKIIIDLTFLLLTARRAWASPSLPCSLSFFRQKTQQMPNLSFLFLFLSLYIKISGEVSLIQWLIFTYHFSNWATCQSHVVYIKISQLQYTIHVLHNSNLAYATPVVNTSLARCLLGLLHIFGQTGATPVALTSTHPLHIT